MSHHRFDWTHLKNCVLLPSYHHLSLIALTNICYIHCSHAHLHRTPPPGRKTNPAWLPSTLVAQPTYYPGPITPNPSLANRPYLSELDHWISLLSFTLMIPPTPSPSSPQPQTPGYFHSCHQQSASSPTWGLRRNPSPPPPASRLQGGHSLIWTRRTLPAVALSLKSIFFIASNTPVQFSQSVRSFFILEWDH